MARLGEVMTASGLLTAEQVEHALRAQVVWGGRLGTNLIELGYIDLEGLSRALGVRHALPTAFARHFDRADPELQARLPAALAGKWSCVPLLRLAQDQIALACIDPLDAAAIAELAEALGAEPGHLVVSVAAELRVRYHLERAYGIQRASRFLRSKGKSVTSFPQIEVTIGPEVELEVDFDLDIEVEPPSPPPPPPSTVLDPPTVRAPVGPPPPMAMPDPPTLRAPVEHFVALFEKALETATPPPVEPATPGRDRRTYVRTLSDEPARDKAALGRIAIRRVAVVTSGAEDAPGVPATLTDALRAIKRGPNRDRVAELVLDALQRHVPDCDAALLLVIRGDAATAWRHFSRADEDAPDLAVALDQPGIVPTAIERGTVERASAGALRPLDHELLRALGKSDGDLVVAPIAIAGTVMCLLAVATRSEASVTEVDAVASAASTAFTRLVRDASR